MSSPGRRAALALAPLLAAAVTLPLAGLAGLTRASALGTPFENALHGYFLDRYPLFAALVVYGAARLTALAVLERGRRPARRALAAPLAVAALLAASLLPTFGGVVLRPAFMAGGGAFQGGMPWLGAHLLGAAVAASLFGAVLGGGAALIRPGRGPRGIARGLAAWAALCFALALLALPGALGLDPLDGWPRRPLDPWAAWRGAGLVAAAVLPHALLVLAGSRARAG